MLDFRDPAIQLNSTKSQKYLLIEMGGFKFQITLKVLFRRETENSGTKYSPSIHF